jgi:hypothetical protein
MVLNREAIKRYNEKGDIARAGLENFLKIFPELTETPEYVGQMTSEVVAKILGEEGHHIISPFRKEMSDLAGGRKRSQKRTIRTRRSKRKTVRKTRKSMKKKRSTRGKKRSVAKKRSWSRTVRKSRKR